MESTVVERQGGNREVEAERSRRQTFDPRKTKRQRGRVRATSVLGNAKSEAIKGASGRAAGRGRKGYVLTRGDLLGESLAEVSRGRSSVESPGNREGAKGRRNESKATGESVDRQETPGHR